MHAHHYGIFALRVACNARFASGAVRVEIPAACCVLFPAGAEHPA
jgi:hypothetical protein